jgi:hypothetical protein
LKSSSKPNFRLKTTPSKKTVREAVWAKVVEKSEARVVVMIAEKTGDPNVALSDAVKKRLLATDAAASGLCKCPETPSLRSPTRLLA